MGLGGEFGTAIQGLDLPVMEDAFLEERIDDIVLAEVAAAPLARRAESLRNRVPDIGEVFLLQNMAAEGAGLDLTHRGEAVVLFYYFDGGLLAAVGAYYFLAVIIFHSSPPDYSLYRSAAFYSII
jgi:hypothetical protein